MSRTTDIERALAAIEGGAFQKLAEAYVYRKYKLTSITALGSQFGTNKAAKGIPDAHAFMGDRVYLVGFTTQQNASVNKLEKDIDDCFVAAKCAGIVPDDIAKVICCHTCQRVSPKDERKLRSKFEGKVELVGPDTIVKDLTHDYADLAMDHLQVPVGTGAITTLDEFITAEERRGYSTPHSKALRGREKDVAELTALLCERQLVIVSGQSGIGKTKLALETVKAYSASAHCEVLAIESRSCGNAAEDINRFLRDACAVVLIDDADQLVDLGTLLRTVLLNEGLHVVMTVRDYARDKVIRGVRGSVEFKCYSVSSLPDETIAMILKEDYGILNVYYIEQIMRIAKGNLRLAVMAGIQAVKHGYPSIRSAHDILDLFFEGLVDSLSKKELYALEQYSLHSVSDLKEGCSAFDALTRAGFNPNEIVAGAKQLSQMSILDIMRNCHDDLAVRFEQQNLRDYLVFETLVRKKDVSLSEYIRDAMIHERGDLVATLNVLLGTFGDESTYEEVKQAATKYWLSLPPGDKGMRGAAMDVLHALLNPYDLMYAQESIEELSFGTIPTGDDYARIVTGPASTTMAILCGTKSGKRWKEGSQLIVSLIDHGGDEACSYKSAFEAGLAPNVYSVRNAYENEMKLLCCMMDWLNEKGGLAHNLSFGLLKICELYLKRQHSEFAPSDSGGYVIKQWELPVSSKLIELRQYAIKGLVTLCVSSPFASDAVKILTSLFSGRFEKNELRQGDLESLSRCLRESNTGLENEEHFWYEVQESCTSLGCDYAELFDHIPSPEYRLARTILDGSLDSDDVEVLLRAGNESLLALADYCCSEDATTQFETYEFARLIGSVLLALAQRFESQKAMSYLLTMWQSGIDCHIFSGDVTRLVDICGYSTVRQTAITSGRDDVLALVDGTIPESDITVDAISNILEAQRFSESTLSVGEVLRINRVSPGFARAFWDAKVPHFFRSPKTASHFLSGVGYADEYVEMLEILVGDDFEHLKNLYLLLVRDGGFDTEDHVLLYLLDRAPSAVDDMIAMVGNAGYSGGAEILSRLGCLSKLHNGFGRLAEIINHIGDCCRWPKLRVASLLSAHNTHLCAGFKLTDFVLYYTEHRAWNAERVALMSNVIAELPINDRFLIFSTILTADDSEELLEVLPLRPLSFSGFGDEGFVPQYMDEIAMLKRLGDTLPREPGYIKHRAYLSQVIRTLENQMQEERWNNFHERF